jgi:hypothetical protein
LTEEGAGNTASGDLSSVSGGSGNTAVGAFSSVSGGRNRTAEGEFDWVAGSLVEDEQGPALLGRTRRGNRR